MGGGGGGGPSANSLLLLNLKGLFVGCCSCLSLLYSCGIFCFSFCHVLGACSCRSMFSRSMSSCSCSDCDVLKSRMVAFVMNLSHLFCVLWYLLACEWERMGILRWA